MTEEENKNENGKGKKERANCGGKKSTEVEVERKTGMEKGEKYRVLTFFQLKSVKLNERKEMKA